MGKYSTNISTEANVSTPWFTPRFPRFNFRGMAITLRMRTAISARLLRRSITHSTEIGHGVLTICRH